jgi:hypothetical protein
VGYGDISPTTGSAQFLVILVAILGILLTGILVSIALSAAKLSIHMNGSLDSLSKTMQQRIAENAAET